MSQSSSLETHRPYGLARVCRLWRVPRSSVYFERDRAAAAITEHKRRGPRTVLGDAELTGEIRAVIEGSPFVGEGYGKVWARLRAKQVRTSKDRVRRLMRQAGLQAPHRLGNAHGPKAHDGVIVTPRPNERWGTDATSCLTLKQGTATVFAVIDHCTAECLGIHAARPGTRWEALEPLRQAVKEYIGPYEKAAADGLQLRHDNGSQFTSDAFQDELEFLAIDSSPSFVREPEGNGCIERFFRTLKEQLLWVRVFETVEELRQALLVFRELYNREWLIERHGHRSPAARRAELLAAA